MGRRTAASPWPCSTMAPRTNCSSPSPYPPISPTAANQRWVSLNTTGLQITQFTGIAVDPTTTTVAYGGSQDNGTEKYTGSLGWNQIIGGDGGITRLDPTNHSILYQEFTGVSLDV